MPYAPPPELASLSLSQIAEMAAAQKLPPVEQWDPHETGDSEMRIAGDGSWYHQGDPISRPAMVRAFSTLLRRESDGSYALVTPYQRLRIAVEDVPFVAVEVECEGTGVQRQLAFRLNTDHLVIASAENPIRFPNSETAPQPYLTVRSGLEAVIARPVYYELANHALDDDLDPFGIWSNGAFFEIVRPS
ncbi:DUF1285 domain-containing protein [Parasphingorhabdus sp.]|uniref:DUF1285 domain-containing protein n=1 Tax=Parasphingorhabdus sp. TaxID=2709688 RepID=UPI0032636C00